MVLHRQNKSAAALDELETLLALEPRNPGYLNLKAAVLARIGDYTDALDVYRRWRAGGSIASARNRAKRWAG